MSGLGLSLRRVLAFRSRPLDPTAPDRILSGPSVRSGRVFLASASSIWGARSVGDRTGHGAFDLWRRGAPVRYELDERAEIRVEFANGLVVMAQARRDGSAMRLTPLRAELASLDLVLVPGRDGG